MVVHACNPSVWEVGIGVKVISIYMLLEAGLGYVRPI